jgi:hypothetical protein
MRFIIYNKQTTLIVRPNWYHQGYKTAGSAKAAMTRQELSADEYAVSDAATFFATIEKQVEKTNILSRKKFMIGVNAPACVDPSTETYHSM